MYWIPRVDYRSHAADRHWKIGEDGFRPHRPVGFAPWPAEWMEIFDETFTQQAERFRGLDDDTDDEF